jgi:hypothetical protein
MVVMSTCFCLGSLLSQRAIEYACPLTVITSGLIWQVLHHSGDNAARPSRHLIAPAISIVVLTISGIVYHSLYEGVGQYELTTFSQWASKNLPPNSRIGNPNWSDFPRLFHAYPGGSFTMGLDPMFGYSAYPEKTETLEKFRTGAIRLTPAELADLLGTDLAYLAPENHLLAKELYDQGYFILYQESDGWLFDLSRIRKKQSDK